MTDYRERTLMRDFIGSLITVLKKVPQIVRVYFACPLQNLRIARTYLMYWSMGSFHSTRWLITQFILLIFTRVNYGRLKFIFVQFISC